MNRPGDLEQHVLAVLVENKAGVLARVADLFARRSYNIVSLNVAPTDNEKISRITIVVDVEKAPLDQIVKQLFKLVNVVEIREMIPESSLVREMVVLNVKIDEAQKPGSTDKLWVRFDNWFSRLAPGLTKGEYWVLYHDQDYQVALVGHPNREYLWLLSRTPTISSETREKLLTTAREQGYDVSELVWRKAD